MQGVRGAVVPCLPARMAVISCLTAIRSRALNDRSGVDSGQRTGAASVRGPATRRATARRRCAAVAQQIGDHTFRATGITTYLKNGAVLENARTHERTAMANHASTRSTQLYGRRRDYISLNEVERIRL